MDMVVTLSKGNPGAATAFREFLKYNDGDTLNIMHLLKFDTLKIHGPRVWMLYKDVHGCNVKAFSEMIINDTISADIENKRFHDERFKMEWEYYA